MNLLLRILPSESWITRKRLTVSVLKSLSLLIVSMSWMNVSSQQVKSPLQLADQYFAAGEYYTAAHLYEQVLNPPAKQKPVSDFPLNAKRRYHSNMQFSRDAIVYKQAESYRLANYWQEAASGYRACADKDPGKYPDALYWFAVCERSLGDYASTEDALNEYLAGGTGMLYQAEAEKELETVHYIRQQLARPDSILYHLQKIGASNSSEIGFYAMAKSPDGHFLVSSTHPDSVQNRMQNPNSSHLFYSRFANGQVESMTPVDIPLTDNMRNQGAATFSTDGRTLYFTQWTKENGKIVSSIYMTSMQGDGWGSPVLLNSINPAGYNSKQPFCTTDGKYLFFASDRPGGLGGFDIWYAPILGDGTTGDAMNAGPMINTASDEQAPFYHTSSSTLVFSSNGRKGMGGFDLFSAKGNFSEWQAAENMGSPVNSSRDDLYYFANENAGLLENAVFGSDRGSGCCLESYTVVKDPKNKKLAGIVIDCKNNNPMAEAEVTIVDRNGQSWKTNTDENGRYQFDLVGSSHQNMSVSLHKDLYKDTTSTVGIKNIDESDWLTDVYFNNDLCIEKKLVIKVENVVTVYFDYDKSDLKPTGLAKMDSIYNVLVENPTATIQISGYTDGRGTVEYNQKLSDRRAKSCADYLIEKGIDENRISFESFGACCPVEMELINGRDNAAGRSKNRRALINISKD